ncbi:CBS domain-containing protein [Roseomonas xinghualingensis]|uniref:CBS domain-containing protein n=1 Tax=Roseomonas xinghualingensis TaxID=2986475 RepID=UPI0021F16F94|nr:CBS domain-containing protein [Roseomonas sp. SXEYE001]MCV4209623.1 CBS domain-containing protein [Roseomonas sp. SXEYE001]
MTPAPVVVPPSMSVQALVQLLRERHVSGVFVVDAEGAPLGVVSEADLIRRLAPDGLEADLGWIPRLLVDQDRAARHYARLHGTRVQDVMTPTLVSVDEEAALEDAVRLMQERGVRRLAVMREGRLAGVVSRADLLKAVAAHPAGPGGERDDSRIRQAITQEMRRYPWVDTGAVAVIVKDGVVQLEGYCRSEDARHALRVMAEQVEGVDRVEDRLEVGPSWPRPDYPLVLPI